jgi:hypothetical protein
MSIDNASIDRLFETEVVQDPHDYYRELREHDPIHEVVPGTHLVRQPRPAETGTKLPDFVLYTRMLG